MTELTLAALKAEARHFTQQLSQTPLQNLYGITDGKKVGTDVEHRFRDHLLARYTFEVGSSAHGIDFPGADLQVDLKVTSSRQPQSSSPFRSAEQKVYGLGYHLLVIVYQKDDDPVHEVARLSIEHVVFVDKEHTGDYQTTHGLLDILGRDGNLDDIRAFLEERNLPLDDVGRTLLAEKILANPPHPGYLTISNALQWRLQYGRVLKLASERSVAGLEDLRD
jgi:restriction system protein